MTSTANFVVHTYHVNINTGDGQIILLVDDSTKSPAKRGTVHAASLLDGGKGDGTQMVKVIQDINIKYDFKDDKHFAGTLRFDSVIISHWDVDHYQGVFGVLRTGFLKTINVANKVFNTANPTAKIDNDTIPRSKVSAVSGVQPRVAPQKGGGDDDDDEDAPALTAKKARKAITNPTSSSTVIPPTAHVATSEFPDTYETKVYQNAYLKYSDIDGDGWTCLSTIYSPYWNAHFNPTTATQRITGQKRSRNAVPASTHGAAWSALTTKTVKYKPAGELLKVTGDAAYTLLDLDTVEAKPMVRTGDLCLKVAVQDSPNGKETVRFIKFANLVSQRNELLGVNFFTNEMPSSGTPRQWRAFSGTTELVNAHEKPAVGLYCISADGEVIVREQTLKKFKATGDLFTAVDMSTALPESTTHVNTNPTIIVDSGAHDGGSSESFGMKKVTSSNEMRLSQSNAQPLVPDGLHSSNLTNGKTADQAKARDNSKDDSSGTAVNGLDALTAPKIKPDIEARLSVNKRPGFRAPIRVVDENTSTGTNRSSIIAVVVFGDGRTQEYLGGDADYTTEIATARWLNQRVPLIKLSHHGAVHSTPLPLINILNPDRIMCSAGDTKTYAHPRWETVLFFALREQVRQKMWTPFVLPSGLTPVVSKPLVFQKPFYNTMYPIWMSDASTFSIDTFEGIKDVNTALSPTAVFVQALRSMWLLLGVADMDNLYNRVRKERADFLATQYAIKPKPINKHKKPENGALTAAQQEDNDWLTKVEKLERMSARVLITTSLSQYWTDISYIGSKFGQPGSKKSSGATSSVVSTNDSILYFLATLSKPGSKFDSLPGQDLKIVLPKNSSPDENIGVDITAWSETGEIELFPPGTHVIAIDPPADLAPVDASSAPIQANDMMIATTIDPLGNDGWLSVTQNNPSSDYILQPLRNDINSMNNILYPADTGLLTSYPEASMPLLDDMNEDNELSFGLVRNQYWYALDSKNIDSDALQEAKLQVGLWKDDQMVNSDIYAGIDMTESTPTIGPLTVTHFNSANWLWQSLTADGDRGAMDATGETWSDPLELDDISNTNNMHFVSKARMPSNTSDHSTLQDNLVIREATASPNSSSTLGPLPATVSMKMATTTNASGSFQSVQPNEGILSKAATTNPVPIVGAPANPTIVYYMSSRRFAPSVESSSQIRLDGNSMPDHFVTRIDKGFIAAKSTLAGDAIGVELADNDKLAMRLGYNGLGGVLSIYGTSKNITAFSLKASMSISGETPSPPWNLMFDTRSLNEVFGRPEIRAPNSSSAPQADSRAIVRGAANPVLSLDAHGILPPASTLVMGLKTVGFQTRLTQVLKVFGFPYAQLLGFDSSVDIDLTVDSTNSRNAVWIYSNLRYTTIIRLQMHVAETQISRITDLLENVSSGISLIGVKIVVVRTSSCNTTGPRTSVVMEPKLSVAATVNFSDGFQFTGTMIFSQASLQLVLTNDSSYTIQAMADWLSRLLGVPGDFVNWIPGLDDIILRQITISLQGEKLTKGNFKIDFEVALKFGKAGKKVVFMLSFSGPPFRFSGMMWTKFGMDGLLPEARALDPLWEPYMTLLPTSGGLAPPYTDLADSVSLLELIPGATITTQPKWLPVDLGAVSLQVDEKAMVFNGTLVCPPPDEGDIPPIKFGSLSLTAWYDRTVAKGSPANFWITLEGSVIITAKDNIYSSAEIDASVKYSSATSEWRIEGSVRDLNLGMLWSFFDAKDCGLMADILSGITVSYLDIVYEFRSGSNAALPSSLNINGIITLGSLELMLQYQHMGKNPVTGEAAWSLRAFLGSTYGGKETIGSIADSLLGESVADILPPFIANVEINLGDGGGPEDAPLQLDVEKGGDLMVLSVRIQLSQTMSITFVQATKEPALNSTNAFSPKRIIRFTLDGFPTVSGIPLLNSLPQPFDEMHYVWVQDNNTDPSNKAFVAGLTQQEIDSINWVLPDVDQIPYKATLKPPASGAVAGGSSSSVVLRAGHHFMVVSAGVVSLDYLFNASKPSAPARPLRLIERPGINVRAAAPPSAPSQQPADNNVAMGTMQKSIGPLSIANVGLQYKGGILWLFLDATIHLGPIEFALLGFGIGLDLSAVTLDNIASFFEKLPGAVHLQINGMGLGFSQPPVTAIGVFMKAVDRTAYLGGVALSFIPYTFLAVGAYEEKDKPDGGSYKSVFVFAKLDGPLITLEFAVISGVKIGFGYNSKIRFPGVSEVTTFPFISDAAIDTKPDPIAVLQNIQAGNWVTPAENQLWMAAGLKVLAFEAVSISAVACFSFGASSLALGIFAEAIARMPTNAPIETCFINVELGIVVYVDFLGGIFRAEAQLSPNSFVICPDCHLTGGFALCYWFPGSDHVGDWVFTIGGYHRSYVVPDHYPKPPRLGISWRLDDCLSITGEAYFAITPKVCMGGGRLEVVFSCGPLYASLNAHADFLVNFKPFHFFGDVGVTVSVEFQIDMGLVSWSVGAHVGCDLHLEGPPFGGVAHVDFYLFGFDIRFGPQPITAPILSLEDFYTFVKETGPKSAPPATDTADPAQSMLLFNLEDGAVAEAATSKSVPGDPWVVRAGKFQFRVSTPFALSKAHCNAMDFENIVPFYAKPMRVTVPVTSEITITITANTNKEKRYKFRATKLMKDVPSAAWDKYDANEDPSSKSADSLLSPANGTTSQLMGLIIGHPNPVLSADTIPAFNAHDAMNEDVFPNIDNPLLPFRPPTQTSWIPSTPAKGDLADYQNVARVWADAPLKGLMGDLLDVWTDVLDWDLSAPEDKVLKVAVPGQSKAAPRTSLVASPPTDILLADFEAYYVGCPAVAAGL